METNIMAVSNSSVRKLKINDDFLLDFILYGAASYWNSSHANIRTFIQWEATVCL